MENLLKLVLIVGLQVCLPLVECANKNLFRIEPTDNITVEVGGFASFSSTTLDKQSCGSIHWVYSETSCSQGSFKTVGTCLSPALDPVLNRAHRLSLLFKDGVTSELRISDIKKEDSGLYALFLTDNGNQVGHSSCAVLTVLNSPTPTCDFKPQNPSIGDTISLECEVPEDAKIHTELTWITSTEELHSKTVYPGMNYQLEHVLKEEDNFKEFRCIAGNSINDGPWCSVNPLMINMTVHVFLHPTYKSTGSEGITLQLECIVVPGTIDHQWSLWYSNTTHMTQEQLITITQDRYELIHSGRFLRITNITDADDGLIITCTALNDVGMNVTSDPVTIVHCSDSNNYVTDELQCDGNEFSPVINTLNYIGIAVVYIVAILAVMSVYWHLIIWRREETMNQEQEEAEVKETQSLKVFEHDDDDEIIHSNTSQYEDPCLSTDINK